MKQEATNHSSDRHLQLGVLVLPLLLLQVRLHIISIQLQVRGQTSEPCSTEVTMTS